MFDVKFTPKGVKDLEKLSKDIQQRVIKKLEFFASQEYPIQFSKPLVNLPPATHRFRVGDYRIAFFMWIELDIGKKCIIWILGRVKMMSNPK